jgi:multidrug efflux pump subunit AcrA (membrane-fusion protein)
MDDRKGVDAPVARQGRTDTVEGRPVVVVPDSQRVAAGIQLASARIGAAQDESALVGVVTAEPERIVAVRAPVSGRLSAADGLHWPAYGEVVSAGRALGQVSDAKPFAAPAHGTVTRVGARPGEFVQAGDVLLELTDLSRPLVRVPWPEDAAPPRAIRIAAAGRRIPAALLGAAPSADSLTGRPAYLYRAEAAWSGGRPGAVVPVSFAARAAPAAKGVVVPLAAVVQWEGLTWAYVRRGPGRYERVPVPTSHPTSGGWVVERGIAPGDSIVVRGAETLLSEEFRGRVTVGEESGE